jgi:threonyl-tRNA synthetase
VEAILKDKDVRVDKDIRDEKLGKRIRDAQLQKIPYMIVVGEKEAQSKTLAVRDRVKGDLGLMTLPDFLEHLETLPDPTR